MNQCFHCDKSIDCAIQNGNTWEMPANAVVLQGGDNFGSSIYDALVDGVYVQILICDDCLTANKHKLQEFKK